MSPRARPPQHYILLYFYSFQSTLLLVNTTSTHGCAMCFLHICIITFFELSKLRRRFETRCAFPKIFKQNKTNMPLVVPPHLHNPDIPDPVHLTSILSCISIAFNQHYFSSFLKLIEVRYVFLFYFPWNDMSNIWTMDKNIQYASPIYSELHTQPILYNLSSPFSGKAIFSYQTGSRSNFIALILKVVTHNIG